MHASVSHLRFTITFHEAGPVPDLAKLQTIHSKLRDREPYHQTAITVTEILTRQFPSPPHAHAPKASGPTRTRKDTPSSCACPTHTLPLPRVGARAQPCMSAHVGMVMARIKDTVM